MYNFKATLNSFLKQGSFKQKVINLESRSLVNKGKKDSVPQFPTGFLSAHLLGASYKSAAAQGSGVAAITLSLPPRELRGAQYKRPCVKSAQLEVCEGLQEGAQGRGS